MLDKGFIQNGGLGVVYILIRSIEQIEQYLILATDIKISNFKVLINKINRFHISLTIKTEDNEVNDELLLT